MATNELIYLLDNMSTFPSEFKCICCRGVSLNGLFNPLCLLPSGHLALLKCYHLTSCQLTHTHAQPLTPDLTRPQAAQNTQPLVSALEQPVECAA